MSNKWLQALFLGGRWSVGSVTKSSPLQSALCPWWFVLFYLLSPHMLNLFPKLHFTFHFWLTYWCMSSPSKGSRTLEKFSARSCPVLLLLWFPRLNPTLANHDKVANNCISLHPSFFTIFLSFLTSFPLDYLALNLRSLSCFLFPVICSIDESCIPNYWPPLLLS